MTTAKKKAAGQPTVAGLKPATQFSYSALHSAQRKDANAPTFLLFHASAAEIATWADVERLSTANKTGAQRPLRELKVAKVAKFLASEARNTIPTAVVIAIDTESTEFQAPKGTGCGQLTLTVRQGEKKPGLIIDGQHRVFGALKFSSDTHLNVIGLLGGDDGGVRRNNKVDSRVRHQVGLELRDIHVQRSIEAKRCRQGRNNLSKETIEIRVRRTLNVKRTTANVVQGLVVVHDGHIRMLRKGAHAKNSVVRLHNHCGNLRARPYCEGDLALLAVVHRNALKYKTAYSLYR